MCGSWASVEIVPGVKVDILLIIFRFLTISGVTAGEANRPLCNLNVKIWPLLTLYFGYSILLVLSRFLYFVFFGVFSGNLGF